MCGERGNTDGYRVKFIIDPFLFREDEESRDHVRDGSFIRAAIAGNRELHLLGRIFHDRERCQAGGGKDRAARLGDAERRFLLMLKKVFQWPGHRGHML